MCSYRNLTFARKSQRNFWLGCLNYVGGFTGFAEQDKLQVCGVFSPEFRELKFGGLACLGDWFIQALMFRDCVCGGVRSVLRTSHSS